MQEPLRIFEVQDTRPVMFALYEGVSEGRDGRFVANVECRHPDADTLRHIDETLVGMNPFQVKQLTGQTYVKCMPGGFLYFVEA